MKVVLVETIPTVNPVPYTYTPFALRSGGWHMKAVLQAIGEQAGLLDPWERPASGWSTSSGQEDGPGVTCTWAAPLWPLMGLFWEAGILPATSPGGHGLGEQEYEFSCGETIYFTPDWVTKLDQWPDAEGNLIPTRNGKRVPCIDECKCTWRSARKPITDWWLAVTQLKSYCMGMGVFRGRLTVVYVNGEYEKHVVGTPVLKRHWIEFTQTDFDLHEELLNGWLQERRAFRNAMRRQKIRG